MKTTITIDPYDLGCEIANRLPKPLLVALSEHVSGEEWGDLCDAGREAAVIGDWLAQIAAEVA